MSKPKDTQVDRLQAGLIAQYEAGVRYGECNGVCATVRRMLNDRGLLAELTGRATVADLVRRFGSDYVRTFLDRHGLFELLGLPISAPEKMRGIDPTCPPNSPQDVGARDTPGGWTGGLTTLADPGDDDGP